MARTLRRRALEPRVMILNRIRAAADAPVSQREPTAPREQHGERVRRASSSSRAHSAIGRLGATLRLVESARQRRCEPILEKPVGVLLRLPDRDHSNAVAEPARRRRQHRRPAKAGCEHRPRRGNAGPTASLSTHAMIRLLSDAMAGMYRAVLIDDGSALRRRPPGRRVADAVRSGADR